MTFKYLLVAVLVGFAFYLVRLSGIGRARKGAMLVVVAAMLVFAIEPEWSTLAARWVGISRGVDLLFYLSHLTLFLLAFMSFLRFKKMESRMTMLVQQLALEPSRAASRRGAPAADGSPAPAVSP
jgi:hypothetical protein